MRIFALETNREKLMKSLLTRDERVIRHTRFHWMRYVGRILRFLIVTAIAIAIVIWGPLLLLPPETDWVLLAVWFLFAFLPLINTIVDWWQDAIVATSEEVVIIDQHTFFQRKIRQMSLENLASVTDQTQWGNIFGFGKLMFDLKEGTGEHIELYFVPHADRMASAISDATVSFHRREIEEPSVPQQTA